MLGIFICLCVSLSQLIEKLASRRGTKIGMQVSNDESTINFEKLSEIFTLLPKNGKKKFTSFICNTMYGFTLTIEIIVRHYYRLPLLLILQSNNLYKCLNYIIV